MVQSKVEQSVDDIGSLRNQRLYIFGGMMDHSDHFTLTEQEVQSLIDMYEKVYKELLDIAEKEKPLRDNKIMDINYVKHIAYAKVVKDRIDELTRLLHTL